jgi:DNA recombination protein RmuC
MPFPEIILFIFGVLTGAVIVAFIYSRYQKSARQLAEELNRTSQFEKIQELEKIIQRMKESFSALSLDALSKSTDEFIKLANQKFFEQSRRTEDSLQNKKVMIDNTLISMKEELSKVQELVNKVENERKQSYGALSEQLKNSVAQTQKLQESTIALNKALSSSQVRGQWGERMAEDVLRMAGLVEGINYVKQKTLQDGSRPDFTFLLPNNFRVNMDVKFPLSNYLSYLKSDNTQIRNEFKKQFLKDVRQRVKEVATRDYINTAENTVDYMIIFIPNEQVYSFINENDLSLLDEALKNKVILSSPVTLYAILGIIRQAVENFNLEKTTKEILSILMDFNKQWELYKEGMDRMGKKLDSVQKEFFELVTTRSNKLEKPLRKIETFRQDSDNVLMK